MVAYPKAEQRKKRVISLARVKHAGISEEETELRMGAEDFGYYTHVIPGCFYRLGVRGNENDTIYNVHTPRFNVNEEAISNGVQMMAWFGAVCTM